MARSQTKPVRQALSPERIVDAALDLIEREGMTGFSTRKLAVELRCEAMSIYHYFPSKGHLLDAALDKVIENEFTVLDPGAADWRQALTASAYEWRTLGQRRPHFFGYLANHWLNTPGGLTWLNGILGLVLRVAPTEEAGVRFFRAFGYYLTGAILDETAGYSRGPSTVEPVSDEVVAERYPHVVRAGKWFQPSQWDATFETGLRAHFDEFERQVRGTR